MYIRVLLTTTLFSPSLAFPLISVFGKSAYELSVVPLQAAILMFFNDHAGKCTPCMFY